MADELRYLDEGAQGLINRHDRDDVSSRFENIFTPPESPISDVALTDNAFFLAPGNHGGGEFTATHLQVDAVPGAKVTMLWVLRSPYARISGAHFVSDVGSSPLVALQNNARVLFRDCIFEMSRSAASIAVSVATGCKAHFDGCAFVPDLVAGTGQPIAHAGPPANVYVTSCVNLTGRAHGTHTLISELT